MEAMTTIDFAADGGIDILAGWMDFGQAECPPWVRPATRQRSVAGAEGGQKRLTSWPECFGSSIGQVMACFEAFLSRRKAPDWRDNLASSDGQLVVRTCPSRAFGF